MTAEELMTTIYELIERNAISPQAEVIGIVYDNEGYSCEGNIEINIHDSHFNTLILEED